MTYQTSQKSNSIDQTELKNLEYRLHQDLLAYKKVMKWVKTIETRIYRTRVQVENIKQQKSIERENVQLKTSSKIPVPSRLIQNIPSVQIKSIKSNLTQNTQNQELNITTLNDESKQIVKLQTYSMNKQVKNIQNKNKTNFESDKILTTSVSNLIDTYIRNRFNPLLTRLEKLELKSNANECLLQEAKDSIKAIAKDIDINAKESENSLNNLKNILINFNSKNLT